MSLPRLSLCTAAVLLALSTLNAQSVATEPVGAVTKTLSVGLNSIGITLLNPNIVASSCTANTTNSLTLGGVSSVGALLTAGLPYYVEAISGPLEGDRFDVDTDATIAQNSGVVVINTTSVNNTVTLAPSDAVGTQFALRKHVTISQLQSQFSPSLVGNNSSGSADQIWLFNPINSAFTVYYLRGDLTTWRPVGSTTSANNVIIPPGEGIVLKKITSSTSLTSTGSVRTNDFAFTLPIGLSFRAPGYPVSYSPSSLGGTAALGWTGNNSSGSADQLRVLDTTTNSFSSYYLRTDGITWRPVGSTTDVSTATIFSFDSGFMISRKSADSNYILTTPFSL